MPRFFLFPLAFVLTLSALPARTSVWKITRGDAVLYLGGTCHLLRPQDFPLPAEFDTAFAASSKIVFETDIARVTSPEMHQVIATQGRYTDGTTLDQVISPSAWEALSAYCQTAGLPMSQTKQMKPWLLTVMITAIELQKLGMSTEGVDIHYFKKASAENKPLGKLETFEQQVEFITQLGVGYESDLIEQSLGDLHELPKLMNDTLAAWKSGDTSTLDRLMLAEIRTTYPALFETMFVQRNAAWQPQIEALLETSEVEFVLVGAGHLPGPKGLLALLSAAGCEVEHLMAAPATAVSTR
ncbi:MAG TPA: TraB/GumN family protein [Opitutus sp.]|nr:TraB/GumN family protein [Opitutus sp.]